MAELEFVRVEVADRVATVTFDRPPVNALNHQAWRELTAAFTALAKSTEAHCVIFTAPGERVFCAGVDLHDSARRHGREPAGDDSIVDRLDPGSIVRDCFWAISDCPLPVIGAINGAAVGAGLALVACCDIIIASETARFALPRSMPVCWVEGGTSSAWSARTSLERCSSPARSWAPTSSSGAAR